MASTYETFIGFNNVWTPVQLMVPEAPDPALPRLAVSGGLIVRADDNRPVILRGVGFMGHEHAGTTSTITQLVPKYREQWRANVFSFGYAAQAVLDDTPHPYTGTSYLTLMDQVRDVNKANKSYTLFSVRSKYIEGRTDPAQTQGQFTSGAQYEGIPGQEAVDSLAKLAARYAGDPSVMFAAQVETNGTLTWDVAREYYHRCVNAVRAAGSSAIVMTSGLDHGRIINGAVTNPVAGDNVVYKTHPYGRATEFQSWFGDAVDAGLPVFIGEFGPVNYGEPAVMERPDIENLLARGLSFAAWGGDAESGSPQLLASVNNLTPSTTFGLMVRNASRRTPLTPGDPEIDAAPTPLGLQGVADSDTQITWTWEAVAGATEYQYQINGGAWTTNGTSTSFVQAVTSGSSNYLTVRALTATDTSLPHPTVGVQTGGGPSLSRNAPVTSNTGTATTLVDGDWSNGEWRSSGYPAIVTLDLNGTPQAERGAVVWAHASGNYIGDSDVNAINGEKTYNEIDSYTIETNPAVGGTVPGTGWVSRVTVTGNTRRSRSHLLDLGGHGWIRMVAQSGNPKNDAQNVDVSLLYADVSSNLLDGYLVHGDSIGTEGARATRNLGGRADALGGGRQTSFEVLGWPSKTLNELATTGTTERTQWLKYISQTGMRHVILALGANDAGGNAAPATSPENFDKALRIACNDALNLGIRPLLCRIPYSTNAQRQANNDLLNAKIDALVAEQPTKVTAFTDFDAKYRANPTLISADQLHPTEEGFNAWAQWLAESVAAHTPVDTPVNSGTIPGGSAQPPSSVELAEPTYASTSTLTLTPNDTGAGATNNSQALRTAITNASGVDWVALDIAPGHYYFAGQDPKKLSGQTNQMIFDKTKVVLRGLGATPGDVILESVNQLEATWTVKADDVQFRNFTRRVPADFRSSMGEHGEGNTWIKDSQRFIAQDFVAHGSADAAVFLQNSHNWKLNRVTSFESMSDAYHISDNSSYGEMTDCVSRDSGDDMLGIVGYGSGSRPHHITVTRHTGNRNSWGRGVGLVHCHDITFLDWLDITESHAAGIIVARESVYGTDTVENIMFDCTVKLRRCVGQHGLKRTPADTTEATPPGHRALMVSSAIDDGLGITNVRFLGDIWFIDTGINYPGGPSSMNGQMHMEGPGVVDAVASGTGYFYGVGPTSKFSTFNLDAGDVATVTWDNSTPSSGATEPGAYLGATDLGSGAYNDTNVNYVGFKVTLPEGATITKFSVSTGEIDVAPNDKMAGMLYTVGAGGGYGVPVAGVTSTPTTCVSSQYNDLAVTSGPLPAGEYIACVRGNGRYAWMNNPLLTYNKTASVGNRQIGTPVAAFGTWDDNPVTTNQDEFPMPAIQVHYTA